jgi:hypothetical protein
MEVQAMNTKAITEQKLINALTKLYATKHKGLDEWTILEIAQELKLDTALIKGAK